MGDTGFFLTMLAGVLALVTAGGFGGFILAKYAFHGDWKRRARHVCGYVDEWRRPTVCPRCGDTDERWSFVVCRWNLGWEFRDQGASSGARSQPDQSPRRP